MCVCVCLVTIARPSFRLNSTSFQQPANSHNEFQGGELLRLLARAAADLAGKPPQMPLRRQSIARGGMGSLHALLNHYDFKPNGNPPS